MATRGKKLDEYTINVGGVDLTVQLTPEEASEQNARRGRADADKTVTTKAREKVALTGKAEPEAPANKADAAPANK